MDRIRAAAARRGERRRPKFTFSIGVYDPSIWTLENFVDRIVRHGATGLTFWDLVEYEHQKLVRSLAHLDAQQKPRAREILVRVARKLDRAGVRYAFVGDFQGMAPKLGVVDLIRRGFGFAVSLTGQYVLARPHFCAVTRRS